MFHGASPNALALANSVILVELLKGMDAPKRLALIDRAAEALEKGPNRQGVNVIEAIKLLRGQWIEIV